MSTLRSNPATFPSEFCNFPGHPGVFRRKTMNPRLTAMNDQNRTVHPHRWIAALTAWSIFTTLQTQAMTSETINRTLDLPPGGTLIINIENGRLDISGEAGSGVVIKIDRSVKASSKEKEEAFLTENPVEIETTDRTVRITRAGESGASWGFSLFRKKPREEATYQVVVPADFNLDLRTSGGEVALTNVKGEIAARTSGGSIRALSLTGDIAVRTSGGSIRLDDCHGPTDAHTSGGSITAENGSDNLKLRTSGGSITVLAHEGRVDGHTSGGSVKATLLAGRTEACSLSTSGGGVTVNLPATAAVDIDASTSGGNVHSEFPEAQPDPKKKTRLVAPINGGGPLLKLHTSGGSIHINRVGDA